VELHRARPQRSRLKRERQLPCRTLLGTLTAAVAGLLVALAPSSHAYATPSPGDYEQMIDQAWNKLEPILEQHNKIKAQLADNKAKVAKLEDQIRPLALQVDLAMSRVSAISVEAYKGGQASMVNAMLTSGSPTTFAEQLSLLDAMAMTQQLEVADVARLKAQYDVQKKPLDDLVAQLAKQEAQIAAQEKSINDQIAQFNKLRLAAYGSGLGTGSLRPAPCPATYDGSNGAKAARVACAQIGKPYVWATQGPNTFDCSGLTLYAWAAVGVHLRHYTGWQWADTTHVSRANLRVGDLVFYYSDLHHMGMYVGGGWIVHAPNSGDVVRMRQMDVAPIYGYGRPG
jgi:peptidoglycan DL-endopeptidase CwlO